MPFSYIVTYWLHGENGRQCQGFNDKEQAKDFMVDIAKSPNYDDSREPATLYGYITSAL